MILIRYEDFISQKNKTIIGLAEKLNISAKNSIDQLLDKQYQPKGDNSKAYLDYYGQNNLDKINLLCKEEMISLGYEIENNFK